MNIQFPAADAHHAEANYHGVIPDPNLTERNVMAVEAEEEWDCQQCYADPQYDHHSSALTLVLQMQEEVMCHATPNLQQHDLAFPRMIVSVGQDFHENHCEED